MRDVFGRCEVAIANVPKEDGGASAGFHQLSGLLGTPMLRAQLGPRMLSSKIENWH